MKLLFDACSIAEIITQRGEDAVNTLAGESTLDLAIYELGNVVWKESRSKKRSEDETSVIVGFVEQVIGVMDVRRIRLSDIREIERNAIRLSLSFYDASYHSAAGAEGRTLVTEDEGLHRAAKETGAPCIYVREICG